MSLHDDGGSSGVEGEEPAPRRGRGRPRKPLIAPPTRAPVPRYEQLGEVPVNDPLAMNEWVHRALGVSAAQLIRDPNLTEQQKRSQLCAVAQRMAALTPQSRIHGAERAILNENQGLREDGGPAMESVDASITATERAARSGGKARRGRPRKRPVG